MLILGPRRGGPLAAELDQPRRPVALACVRLEQFQHARVVGDLASQRPAHHGRDVIVTHADRVGVAAGPLPDLGRRPRPDAGQRAQAASASAPGSTQIASSRPATRPRWRWSGRGPPRPRRDASPTTGWPATSRQAGRPASRPVPGREPASPCQASSRRQARCASTLTTFCSSTAGTSASSTRPVRLMRSPASCLASSRSRGWSGWNAAGSSLAPSRSGTMSSSQAAPSPQARALNAGPARWRPGWAAASRPASRGQPQRARPVRGQRRPPDDPAVVDAQASDHPVRAGAPGASGAC